MASQESHSQGLTTRDAATVVPPESPPFRAGRFKIAHRFSVQLFALVVVVCGGLYVQKDGETDFFVWHRSIIISA